MNHPDRGDIIECGIKMGDTIHRRVARVDIVRAASDGSLRLSGTVRANDGRWQGHPRMLREPWEILERKAEG